MSTRTKARIAVGVITLIVAAWIAGSSWPFIETAGFLVALADPQSAVARRLISGASSVDVRELAIPTRIGVIEGRLYSAASPSHAILIVVPGVHGGGADEPRLEGFSQRLATNGLRVLTLPLPDLRAFQITGRSTDAIEDAVSWVTSPRGLAPDESVGLLGVSFAGGLAIVAAGRPSLAGRISAVISIGGHGDIGRVLEYLCSGSLPDGTPRAPHDYSVAIVALAAVPRLVPADQAPQLTHAIRAYLDASVDESAAQVEAHALLAEARAEGERMAEPSRSIMQWINDREVARLGAAIRPHIAALAEDARLSPERSPAPLAPVFLLHGDEDNVIPSSETPRLAAYLNQYGRTPVRALLTPALSHMGLNPHIDLSDQWRLVSFWTSVRQALH